MGRFVLYTLILCFIASSCASKTPSIHDLNDVVNSNRSISIPINISEDGLIFFDKVRVGETDYRFLLDTGATQSAIFETTLSRSDLHVEPSANTLVHGMVTSAQLPTIEVSNIELGSLIFTQKTLIVLPDRDEIFKSTDAFDGIIGMDILASYQIYVSPGISELKLIPNDIVVTPPVSWDRMDLIANPFKNDNRNLHFIEVRVAGKIRPALVDTGSEFSVMNWNSAQYAQVKSLKNRMRKKWEMQGATGTFKPVAKVTLETLRSGQKFWSNKDFLVMDFDSLETLGLSDDPFLIVGMNLFKDETFLIDFERNYIAIKPRDDNL